MFPGMSKHCPYYGCTVLYADCLECEHKYCKTRGKSMKKISIGIDQSYKDSGISVSVDGTLKTVSHCYTEKLKNNTAKRQALNRRLNTVFKKMSEKAYENDCELICVIERIRLQSQGFINIDYIKSIGALNAMIVDLAALYNIPVYSVDTRAWKSAVVGTSKEKKNKYGIDSKKWPTILWLISKGFENSIKEIVSDKKKKGVIFKNGERFTYNDNAADSAAISLFPFYGSNSLLKEEH